MMKRKLFVCLWCVVLVLSFSGVSFAVVTGSGSMDLNIPSGGSFYQYPYQYGTSYTDPITGEYVSLARLFGSIWENPGPYIPYELDPTYQGYGSYHDSEITGSLDPGSVDPQTGNQVFTGSQDFTFQAVSPDPGNVTATTSIGFNWGGTYSGTLDSTFGYSYSFTGQKDDPSDLLMFIVQMEIGYRYQYYDEITQQWLWDYLRVYSDYGTSGFDPRVDPSENFRTNWVYYPDAGSGMMYSGNILFDYSDFGPQEWVISWDFGGVGRDTAGGGAPAPVPEPATMLLLGSGLAGLAGFRRRFCRS